MDKRPDSLQMLDGSFAKGEHSATIATRTVESLEALLHSERRRFHRAVAVFANINGDLEDRVVTLEAENVHLRQENEALHDAWAVDETIQPDGSLRPSLADTARRAAELEAENRKMRQEREKITNTLWMISKESEPDPNGFDPIYINGAERIYNMVQELLQPQLADAEGGRDG